MDTRPIGVFDSGLGGLTAVKELERLIPNENIVYFGDTGRVPYGSRGTDTIKKYAISDMRFLLSFNVKAIVIACGTVSSVAFEEVRKVTDLPVIGVVEPAAKAAVKASRSGKIGAIATSATVGSGSYEKSILKMNPDAEVKTRACPLFVPLVENGYFERDCKIAQLAAHDYLDEFSGKVDTLILGCTHYPLLRGVIEDILPGVALVDSGLETAKTTVSLLCEKKLLNTEGNGSVRYYVSDRTSDFSKIAGIFLEHPVNGMVEKVNIEKY
ncbi:MAG TPA: glutamate racemase [Ruminiclostridium sp.]|nr:glutamate racemase [Ruminiclostridium sp.]